MAPPGNSLSVVGIAWTWWEFWWYYILRRQAVTEEQQDRKKKRQCLRDGLNYLKEQAQKELNEKEDRATPDVPRILIWSNPNWLEIMTVVLFRHCDFPRVPVYVVCCPLLSIHISTSINTTTHITHSQPLWMRDISPKRSSVEVITSKHVVTSAGCDKGR